MEDAIGAYGVCGMVIGREFLLSANRAGKIRTMDQSALTTLSHFMAPINELESRGSQH